MKQTHPHVTAPIKPFLLGLALLFAVPCVGLVGFPSKAYALKQVHLLLDWFPNADHVPLYVAQEKGFFAQAGLKVKLTAPANPNDPLKLTAAGQVDYAVNYQPQVIISRSRKLPIRAFAVLVEHPLSSLAFLKKSGIRTPADLRGKTIGYSVQELELALLKAVAASAGLTPEDYKTINVNFNLMSSLLSGQVDAVMGAFWNYELAELELEKVEGGYFALEKHGVPDYYELMLIAHEDTLKNKPQQTANLVKALDQAIVYTKKYPEKALKLYFKANPQGKKVLDRKAFTLVRPLFAGTQRQSHKKWADLLVFLQKLGVIERSPKVADLYRNFIPSKK